MADWPVELPQNLNAIGFSNTFQSGVIRSEVDIGPPKVRRRYSAATEYITGTITIDKVQYNVLLNFYKNVLYEGTLSFTWNHPVTGDIVSMRFKEPPRVTSKNQKWFDVELNLEILP